MSVKCHYIYTDTKSLFSLRVYNNVSMSVRVYIKSNNILLGG